MNLYNSIVAITGGNDGLGLSLVRLLSLICKKIYVIDRSDNYEILENLSNIEYIKCDLLKNKPKILKVDVFISNVGMSIGPKLAKDCTYKEIEDMINLNIISHLWCFKNMRYKKFVFIDSVMSFIGLEYYSMYCACKAFIRVFNESLQRENQDTLIVFPYKLNTKMFDEIKDIGTLDVEEVAMNIKKAIENDSKELYLPFSFRFLETIKGLIPSFVRNPILNRIVRYFMDTKLQIEQQPTVNLISEVAEA